MFDSSNTKNKSAFETWDKERLEEMINKYDKDMLTAISDLYASIGGDRIDFEGISNAVDALTKYNSKSEYNYLNHLLVPEKCKGGKIPSPIPVPSCSFQLHNCVTLSPNNSGNIAILFNPYFLSSNQFISATSPNTNNSIEGMYSQDGTYYNISNNAGANSVPKSGEFLYAPTMLSSLLVNNSPGLTGTESNENFRPVNINQSIPPVYDQYRLVSASVVVKYIGRLDIVSGVIGGAIVFDENNFLNGTGYYAVGDGTKTVAELKGASNHTTFGNIGSSKYGNFDLGMDSFYHQENLCLEGIRELYFPLDNSYEEYSKLINSDTVSDGYYSTSSFIELNPDQYKSGFNFFIYTLGAPTGSCLKLDIYCNFECLPSATFLNYMPISVSTYGMSNQEKKDIITTVQEKPILKAGETIEIQSPSVMGWKSYMKNMAKRFKTAMPSIGKLIGIGLNNIIPKLKPALSVVGTLIGSMAQGLGQSIINQTPGNMDIETK